MAVKQYIHKDVQGVQRTHALGADAANVDVSAATAAALGLPEQEADLETVLLWLCDMAKTKNEFYVTPESLTLSKDQPYGEIEVVRTGDGEISADSVTPTIVKASVDGTRVLVDSRTQIKDIPSGSKIMLRMNNGTLSPFLVFQNYRPDLNGAGRTLFVHDELFYPGAFVASYHEHYLNNVWKSNNYETSVSNMVLNDFYPEQGFFDQWLTDLIEPTNISIFEPDAKIDDLPVTYSAKFFILSAKEFGVNSGYENDLDQALDLSELSHYADPEPTRTAQMLSPATYWPAQSEGFDENSIGIYDEFVSGSDLSMGVHPCFTLSGEYYYNSKTKTILAQSSNYPTGVVISVAAGSNTPALGRIIVPVTVIRETIDTE